MDDLSQARPVLVSIRTQARDENGNREDEVRMLASGVIQTQKDGALLLKYTETAEQEDGTSIVTDVRMKLQPGHVILLRKGPFGATMVFSRGQRYEGTYHTPYGDMDMAIYTTRLFSVLGADHGTLKVEYQLDINGGFSSMRKMTLEYGTEERMKPC